MKPEDHSEEMRQMAVKETSAPKPGDDLSYYLGPDAKCATQEQCDELERMIAEAARGGSQ